MQAQSKAALLRSIDTERTALPPAHSPQNLTDSSKSQLLLLLLLCLVEGGERHCRQAKYWFEMRLGKYKGGEGAIQLLGCFFTLIKVKKKKVLPL